MRLQSYNPNWIWLDQTLCDKETAKQSPWLCYFPTMERLCNTTISPEEEGAPTVLKGTRKGKTVTAVQA
jgi:hypothetical protein